MAKRIFQGVVLFFALYAFVFLPLGKKSALEHIRAIWATPAAQQAASEVKGGVTRLVRRLENEARKSSAGADRGLEQDDERDSKGAERDMAQLNGPERKTSGRRTAEDETAADKTAGDKTVGDKTVGDKTAGRKTAERKTSERGALERDMGEGMEAEAPRSTQKSRLRALSAEAPVRDEF
jgi:hypothetical protein